MKPGSVVQLDWYLSKEGDEILRTMFQPNKYRRKEFGLLEKPNIPIGTDEVNYKLLVYGKGGIGKSSTIARLAGVPIEINYTESAGINVTRIYWPAKLLQSSRTLIFRLDFWDSSEITMKKFDHVLTSCKEEADAILFLFSFTDKASFDDIPTQMSQIPQATERLCRAVIGTRCDLHTHTNVTVRDVRDFEQKWKIPVIKIKNVTLENQSKTSQKPESDVALALNILCEQLWNRDQALAEITV